MACALCADWPYGNMRVGEYADVKYVRMLVNLERNCDFASTTANMLCYRDDEELQALLAKEKVDNLLQWSGWTKVGKLQGRDSQDAGGCCISPV